MKVLSASRGLKIAALAVFLSVIFAVVESIVLARAPWWALPIRAMEKATVFSFAGAIVGALLLVNGVKATRWIFLGVGFIWVGLSTFSAIHTRNPGLGFFSIFLSVYIGLMLYWIRHEMGRSFLDPNMRWYEGLPKNIPALSCEIVAGETRTEMKVSRLDEEGTFIFTDSARVLADRFPMSPDRKSELVFRFRDRQVNCHGVPMSFFKRTSEGVGFRFFENSMDQRKDLGDFIEALRGEGYV
jgi:hypothetical protein